MRRQIVANQLIDGTSWDGFTHRNHLYAAFADNPTVYIEQVERIMDVDMGMDFVSMVEKHNTYRLPAGSDGRYEWKLDYMPDSNYECLGSYLDENGATPITSVHKPGINGTIFYMDFKGDVFQNNEVVEGPNPDTDIIFVKERFPVYGDVWRYKVVMQNQRTETSFIDYRAVQSGTFWSEGHGLVSNYLSDDGPDISFRTPIKAENELAAFRLKHQIAGHNIDYRPKYFFYKDQNGNLVDKPLWISTVEYEMMRKIRKMRANLVMNGRRNRDINTGRVNLLSDAGFEIISGSGWKEQVLASNRHYFTGRPNMTHLLEVILDVVVGTTSWGSREAIVRAGEYGLIELSRMIREYLGDDAYKDAAWLQDTTGRAYSWSGNNLTVNTGQIAGAAFVNGIKLTFMLDSSKDDPVRNKVPMPNLPGLASSYQYDIIGLGGKDEKTNMEIVRVEGRDPIFGVLEGMRGVFNGGTSFNNPKSIASAVDGSTFHYFEPGVGARIKDPTRVISYWPDVLTYN